MRCNSLQSVVRYSQYIRARGGREEVTIPEGRANMAPILALVRFDRALVHVVPVR
jgi:hypothetical protein